MKTRVKVVKYENGDIRYFPQVRRFFIWYSLYENWYGYQTKCSHRREAGAWEDINKYLNIVHSKTKVTTYYRYST